MTTILEQLSENPRLYLHRHISSINIKDELEKYLVQYWLEQEQVDHINSYAKYSNVDRDYAIFTCIKRRNWITKELGCSTEVKVKIHEYITLTTDYDTTNFIIYEILDPKVEIRLSFSFEGLSYTYKYFKTKITNTFKNEIDKLIKKNGFQNYFQLKGLEMTVGIAKTDDDNVKSRSYNYIKELYPEMMK